MVYVQLNKNETETQSESPELECLVSTRAALGLAGREKEARGSQRRAAGGAWDLRREGAPPAAIGAADSGGVSAGEYQRARE